MFQTSIVHVPDVQTSLVHVPDVTVPTSLFKVTLLLSDGFKLGESFRLLGVVAATWAASPQLG